MLRTSLALLLLSLIMGDSLQAQSRSSFGDPLPRLTGQQLARFQAGRMAFEEVEGPADGVGPVFNHDSCVACHDGQATGGGSSIVSVRIGARIGGRFDPLIDRGGPVIQTQGIQGSDEYLFLGEVVPDEATIVAERRTPPLFGLGLVDAIPDWHLIALAWKQAVFVPSVAGRPHFVSDLRTGEIRAGRLGWKAAVPNLLNFSGDAYKEEMGITTPGWLRDEDGRMIDEENPPQGCVELMKFNPSTSPNEPDLEDVELFAEFMTYLAPPPRGPTSVNSRLGEAVFAQVGCADCHVPVLYTGFHLTKSLCFQPVPAYSDFLLHDMGALGDGIEQGQALGREMRTAPLWGLKTQSGFLHDGRANSIDEAIRLHSGQGTQSRNRYLKLPESKRSQLLLFLNSL